MPEINSNLCEPAFQEFLYLDPDTGEVAVYIFDGESCRAVNADEVALSFIQPEPLGDIDMRQCSDDLGSDVTMRAHHPEIDDLIARYERAFG